MHDPRILVLDEPANGLDPQGIRWLRDFLRSLADEGRTILLSSHVLAEVAQTVDDVVVIDHGRLVTHQPLAELLAREHRAVHPHPLRAADRPRCRAHGQRSPGPQRRVRGPGRHRFPTETIGQIAFDNAVVIHEISTITTNLEETFLNLTSDPAEEART